MRDSYERLLLTSETLLRCRGIGTTVEFRAASASFRDTPPRRVSPPVMNTKFTLGGVTRLRFAVDVGQEPKKPGYNLFKGIFTRLPTRAPPAGRSYFNFFSPLNCMKRRSADRSRGRSSPLRNYRVNKCKSERSARVLTMNGLFEKLESRFPGSENGLSVTFEPYCYLEFLI